MGDTFAYGMYLDPDRTKPLLNTGVTNTQNPNQTIHGNNGDYELGDTLL